MAKNEPRCTAAARTRFATTPSVADDARSQQNHTPYPPRWHFVVTLHPACERPDDGGVTSVGLLAVCHHRRARGDEPSSRRYVCRRSQHGARWRSPITARYTLVKALRMPEMQIFPQQATNNNINKNKANKKKPCMPTNKINTITHFASV